MDAASYLANSGDQPLVLSDLGSKSIAPQIDIQDGGHADGDPNVPWCGNGKVQAVRQRMVTRQRQTKDGELSPPAPARGEQGPGT